MRMLPDRILCLVTDLERAGGKGRLLNIVDLAVQGGVNMVQVRGHELDEEALTELARSVVEAVAARAVVVVNGASEVAARARADGVHLRESGELDRNSAGGEMVLGKSVHGADSAQQAESEGADYVVLGTVFPSASHPGGQTVGTKIVASVSSRLRIPIIGIGGITAENAPSVIEAGAAGVAVIGAIISANDPLAASSEIAQSIGLSVRD